MRSAKQSKSVAVPPQANEVEKPAPVAEPPEEPTDITDDVAFNWRGGGDVTDTQKALLSIAYLMDWMSEVGNKPLPPFAIAGLAEALRHGSREVGKMFMSHELGSGVDPNKVRRDRGFALKCVGYHPDGRLLVERVRKVE